MFLKILKCYVPVNKSLHTFNVSFSSCITSRHLFDCITYNSVNYMRSSSKQYFLFLNSYRYMAGHAKWQNVKHIKAEKDRLKSNLCNKYTRLITYAIRENGPDPKLNSRLASLLEEAKKMNVPNSSVENILKKSNNKKLKPGTIEIVAPGGCLIILEYETENVSTMRHYIKTLCKKYSASILSGEGGRWRAVFQQKGVLKAGLKINGQEISSEKALDSAIEAGAEEVQKKEDENEVPYLEFICDPADLHPVKKELEKMSFNLDEAYIGYIPMSKVQLTDEDVSLVDGLLSELSDFEDVVRLHENVQ